MEKRTGDNACVLCSGQDKNALPLLEIKGRKGHNDDRSFYFVLVALPAWFLL